jgi:hypothetical protein
MASGTWTYTISSSATDALDAGDSVTDTYAFAASDSTTQTVTITITGANDAPVFSDGGTASASVEEGATTVATYAATDADDSAVVTYSVSGGADSALFSVVSTTGALSFSTAPDYDSGSACAAGNSCVVELTASDAADTDTITVTIAVTDANDQTPTYSATDTTPSVLEGTTAADAFAITDTDTGDSNACTLAGADSALFTCTVSGDSVSLAFTTAPDYESPGDADADNIHAVTVTISDGVNTGSTISYTVTVTDSTSVLIQTGQTGSVAEDASVGDSVMTLTITDGTPTAIIISTGNGDGVFAISTAGVITVADVTNLDYETTSSYTLTLVAYDASSSDVADVTVSITDVNDAPTVATAISDASIAEDAAYSLDISSNFADQDSGDVLSFSATGLPSSGNLAITTAGVISGTPLNADVGAHTIVVTATDDDSTPASVTDTYVLTVTNTNDAPTV